MSNYKIVKFSNFLEKYMQYEISKVVQCFHSFRMRQEILHETA